MKFTRGILTFSMLIAIMSVVGFGFKFQTMADEWFDSYPKIAWKIEIVRLKNLNYFLQGHPETVGCIIYRWTDKNDKKDMRERAERARAYLIHELKMDRSRVVVIDGKQTSESETILQPVPKGAPRPTF
jgi:hypothetical protein